jgi:phosphoenolpyruvate phosphomutase
MGRAGDLRKLLAGKRPVYVMGAHNGLSARLAERNSFDAIWASGLEVSASFAVPDANILTMTQYLEKSAEMCEATSIPVVSDCDTGYGNSSNVIHMVRKFEAAGVAAVCIEDKLFPKMNSFVKGRQELAPIGEFVGKIMAAKSARVSPDFMVIARTEAFIAGWGEEEALLRAAKYVEAGADAILVHSKRTDAAEVIGFADKWRNRAPLVIVPTTYPGIMDDFSDAELIRRGIRMVIFANQGIRAAIRAMDNVMGKMRRSRGTCDLKNELVPMADVFDLQGVAQLKEKEKKYLKTRTAECSAVFLAAGSPKNQEDLAPLLRDRPVALLDINGRTLIERNMQTLAQAGIQDVAVVTGYRAEHFRLENAQLIHNPEYADKGILRSLLAAREKLNRKVLVLYADILIDRTIVEKLLNCDDDIVLAVDATFKKMNLRNKKLDLVVTDRPPAGGHRLIEGKRTMRVLKIGSNLPPDTGHYEFVGLMLLTEKGAKSLQETAAGLATGKSRGPATINDAVQALVDGGTQVSAVEVNSGWMEIHTFENYKAACATLSGSGNR